MSYGLSSVDRLLVIFLMTVMIRYLLYNVFAKTITPIFVIFFYENIKHFILITFKKAFPLQKTVKQYNRVRNRNRLDLKEFV